MQRQRTRSRLVEGLALAALLAACSGDDQGDDGGGAGSPSSTTGGSSTSPNTGGSGNASPTGGRAISNAGAPSVTGGRASGFGGVAPSLGGNPVQGGSPGAQGGSSNTQGGSAPAATGGSANPNEPTLESLTPDELAELCADARASFDSSGATETAGELTCRTAGIFAVVLFEPSSDAELQGLCQETYDECVAEPLELDDDCEENATCSATVSEFKACVAEYPEYLEQVAMGMPKCSELTMANLEAALGFEPEPTPACASLWDECPASGP